MVGMKIGETTKWSNIAFNRLALKLPASSMPNVNQTTCNNPINERLCSNLLTNHRYRTELSLKIPDYSTISQRMLPVS